MNPAPSAACVHCGTPVPPHASDARFCCGGCAYVHQLLLAEGMERFYELKGTATLPPVSAEALRTRDDEWLRELVSTAEAIAGPGGMAELELSVQGLTCVGCVWLLERVFKDIPGAGQLNVHVARGELNLRWVAGEFDVPAFVVRMQQFGYLAGPSGGGAAGTVQSTSFGLRTGLCGAFAMNAMAFSLPAYLGMGQDFVFASLFDIIAAASATLSVLVGGSYFMERSYHSLRHGVLHMDTPIALGILLAWVGSLVGWLSGASALQYFDFVSVFVFLMLAGRWLQQGLVEKNRRRLLATSAVPERVARVAPDGSSQRVTLQEIQVGDVLHIPPGGICQVRGNMECDGGTLSLEWINGESAAVPRDRGQSVPSGAVNIGTLPMEVRVAELWEKSLLHRLQSSTGKEGAGLTTSPLLAVYLGIVLSLGVAGAVGWWFTAHGVVTALQVMISVFVVSCPCALGVAVPFADDLAASRLSRLGVFVRTGTLWARLLRVKKVIFDKTGTVTLENPVLANPAVIDTLDAEAKAALRVLVSSNLHPVSRSLFDAVGPGPQGSAESAVEEVLGKGMKWTTAEGNAWTLGRPGWQDEEDVNASNPESEHDTVLARNGRKIAGFRFVDLLRPETVTACDTLRARGHKIHLLSGDREGKVRTVAGQLLIPADHWQAEMTPQEKATRVASLDDRDTLYIGDGANDTLALEAAYCGGSPVTGRNFLEHRADFYFLGNSLRFVPELLLMARRRARAVWAVTAFALSYNAAAVALSLAGCMSPLLAAILMPLSSLVTLGLVGIYFRESTAASTGSGAQERGEMEQTMRRQGVPVPIS